MAQDDHVIIIGGGFGGISAAKKLRKSNCRVTIIDKTNNHLFQPLLYQVATAALSPGDIAEPIRAIFGDDDNIRVILGEVTSVDKENNQLQLRDGRTYDFNHLIMAPGAQYNYFGNDDWEDYAPGLKTIPDALNIRERILLSLEKAEELDDPALREPYLTYVIVGGGPTGVEMAGAIAEIAKRNMMRDYSQITENETRVFLVEAGPRILNGYPKSLSKKACDTLEGMGVRVLLDTPVTDLSKKRVSFGEGSIKTPNIIWAAGVAASPLLNTLDTQQDRTGRVHVTNDLSIPGHPNIYVIGDAAYLEDEYGDPPCRHSHL